MLRGIRRRFAPGIRCRGISDGPQESLCVRQFQVSRHHALKGIREARFALINFHSAERRSSS